MIFKPTVELRWIKRLSPSGVAFNLILQQKWVRECGTYVNAEASDMEDIEYAEEWRDVPLVSENINETST